MKLTKRLLVSVLSIALLTSVFAFTSVAEVEREYDYRIESFTKAEQILEYYALDEYLADNYEDGSWTKEQIKAANVATFKPKYSVVADPTGADNKVLSVTLPRNKTALGYTFSADGDGILTDKLIVSARVYFDASATSGLSFKLNAGLRNEVEAGSRYFDIIKVDMKNGGAFTYAGWNDNDQVMVPGQYTYEGWNAETGVWYDFLITFKAEDDVYNAVVTSVPTDDSEPVVLASTGNIAINGAVGMAGFNISADASASNVGCYFDNFEIYEGSITRSPSNKEANTDIHVADLVDFYNQETTDFATKLRIADIFYELSAVYGVTLIDETAYTQMNETLAKEFVNRVGKIDSTLDFFGRFDCVEAIAKYDNKLSDNEGLLDLPGITEEIAAEVVAAREIFAVEKAAVYLVRDHSDNLIDFLTNVYDEENTDYIQMKVWLAELNDEYVAENPEFAEYDVEKYPYQTRFYTAADTRYGALPELVAKYEAFVAKFTEIETAISGFIGYVDAIETATTFGPKYTAYVAATEIYNNGAIHEGLDNATHAKLTERIAYYLEQVDGILAKKDECEYFMDLVNQTSIASYYTILVEKIDLAVEAYANIEPDYENIAEFITVYQSLLAYRESLEAEADAYIAAVAAIEDAEGFYAKKEAVKIAAELKVKGDILGYAGVEEANIAFSAADADVKFRENSSIALINLVAQINETESIAERRELLRLADVANANADDEIKGVEVAKAAFVKAVAEFKADVAVANASITAATDVAAALAAAVKGACIFN